MHIGFEASGAAGLLAQLPPAMAPGGSDAGNRLVSVFPAVSLALMWLERGDLDRAARMYEQAGPVRSWDPLRALRLIAWAMGLAVAIGLARTDDVAYLAGRFEPLRAALVRERLRAPGSGTGRCWPRAARGTSCSSRRLLSREKNQYTFYLCWARKNSPLP